MNIVEFSEFLVTKITKFPENVSITEFKKDDVLTIEILVDEADMGSYPFRTADIQISTQKSAPSAKQR